MDPSVQNEKLRRRQPIDDELKVRWALERYTVPMPDSREIAAKYGRDEATVSRAISSAFTQGLVIVTRAEPSLRQPRNHFLEARLRQQFPSVLSAIVVEDAPTIGDPLHQRLGEALAEEIFEARLQIRHGDKVAIGAGRTLYHLGKRLCSEAERLRAQGVEIISLCGDSYPYHDVPQNVCLDADNNVNQFAQAFQHPAKAAMTSRPIFMTDADQEQHAADHSWHGEYYGRWIGRPVSMAISGLGVFDPKHQLVLLSDPKSSADYPPIHVDIELREAILGLWNQCQELRGILADESYFPVAEVGMCLFQVPPPGGVESTAARILYDKIGEAIKAINPRLFAPRLEHLSSIGSLILLAGGKEKAGALQQLLQPSSNESTGMPTVSNVCTDSTCATQVLAFTSSR